jgi:hypothetical protein
VSDSLYEVAWNYAGQLGRHYVLDTAGLVVPRDVYVGVVMETSNSDQGMPRAVLGLDVHTTAVKAFGEQGEWFLSQLPGALALRPFFRGTPGDLGTATLTASPLRVYPIPARDQLFVEGAAKRLEVINLLGAVVLRAERAEDSAPWILDVRGLPAGAYVLRSDAGQPLRFIKQ